MNEPAMTAQVEKKSSALEGRVSETNMVMTRFQELSARLDGLIQSFVPSPTDVSVGEDTPDPVGHLNKFDAAIARGQGLATTMAGQIASLEEYIG